MPWLRTAVPLIENDHYWTVQRLLKFLRLVPWVLQRDGMIADKALVNRVLLWLSGRNSPEAIPNCVLRDLDEPHALQSVPKRGLFVSAIQFVLSLGPVVMQNVAAAMRMNGWYLDKRPQIVYASEQQETGGFFQVSRQVDGGHECQLCSRRVAT